MPEPDLGPLRAIISRPNDLIRPAAEAISVLLVAAPRPNRERWLRALHFDARKLERTRTGDETRERAVRGDLAQPSVVFVDLDLADTASDDFFVLLRRSFPQAVVLALGPDLSGERAARLLGMGVPSLPLPRDPEVLAELARKLAACARTSQRPEPPVSRSQPIHAQGDFATSIEAYVESRGLSTKQRAILRLYLAGSNDKQIAEDCGCSVATVYEHWRRMAKKVGGAQKGDVIADFHRFLDAGTSRPDPKDRKAKSEIP